MAKTILLFSLSTKILHIRKKVYRTTLYDLKRIVESVSKAGSRLQVMGVYMVSKMTDNIIFIQNGNALARTETYLLTLHK